jgi:predicted nucleic acid-binding Zn finger protein
MKQQLVESNNKLTTKKDRCEGNGRVLAISRRIYRLMQTDVYYVESESTDNVYYYVRYKPDMIEWCSCLDNSTRGLKCKHQFAIEFAIRMGTLKDIDKLPAEAKKAHIVVAEAEQAAIAESYRNDEYSF